MEVKHKTVLLKETINALFPLQEGVYIDTTLGAGGHSKELLANLTSGELIVFDVDSQACQKFKTDLLKNNNYSEKSPTTLINGDKTVRIINGNFKSLADLKAQNVKGIIADLGFATDQLDSIPGLSFLKDEELDMRMDKSLNVKAADLLNALYPRELEKLFSKYGDISFAKKLAKEVCTLRNVTPFNRTLQLNDLVKKIVPFKLRKGDNKHPEAKVYQALRIAVNDELNSLQALLKNGFDLLSTGGKFAVISFHSGEDRLVKDFFREQVENNQAQYVVKLLIPTAHEVLINNNSRSAKLRVIEKM